jgi:uncharacterized protein (TIGR02145 family)
MKRIQQLTLYPVMLLFMLGLASCKKEEPVNQATISTLSVTNITTNTAQSGGNITSDGGGEITSRGMVWSTQPNPTAEQNTGLTMDGSGPGLFQSNLTNLQPNTTYYVRAYATNEAGMVYGSEQQFETEGTTPEVTTNAITIITPNSALSGGTVSDDSGSNVTSRGIVWSTIPNPTFESNLSGNENGSGTGSFTSYLTELAANTTYYVRAYAINSVGVGYGEQLSFKTKVDTPGTLTDIDGNVYRTVIIGNQEWMAENISVTRDPYGNNITRYCYNNDATNCDLYGGLYMWQTMMNGVTSSNTNPSNVQGICPTGWHVPSDAEWTELVDYIVAQGYPNSNVVNGAGNALKSCRQVSSPLGGDCATSEHPRWSSYSIHYGTDEFGFSALPGGVLLYDDYFIGLGGGGRWWSSTESIDAAWYRVLSIFGGSVDRSYDNVFRGFSVRCVRDI